MQRLTFSYFHKIIYSVNVFFFAGLCNLFREGVDLEVLSVDSILEEMRLDGILTSDDDKINHFIAKRNTWKGNFLKRAVC